MEKLQYKLDKLVEDGHHGAVGVLRETVVSRILWGSAADCEITKKMCQAHMMRLDGNAYCAVCFDVCREDKDEYSAEELVDYENQIARLSLALRDKWLETGEAYEGFERNMIPCLICLNVSDSFDEDPTAETWERTELFEQISAFLVRVERDEGICAVASAGSIHRDFGKLSQSFEEARTLHRFRRIMNINDRLMYFHDYMYDPPASGVIIDSNLEKQLFGAARSCHFELANMLLHDQVNALFYDRMPPVTLADFRLSALKSMVISLLMDVAPTVDGLLIREPAVVQSILSAETVNAFVRRADCVFGLLKCYSERQQNRVVPDWVHGVIELVGSEFSNPDLNISYIARRMEMNSVQLSKLFKEYVGTNLLEYIHTVRLREAKKMLGCGKSLERIAAEVGYGTTRTMSRAFIKYEGITPGRLNSAVHSDDDI